MAQAGPGKLGGIVDTNQDGQIDQQEFAAGFQKVDKNNDGVLSEDEINVAPWYRKSLGITTAKFRALTFVQKATSASFSGSPRLTPPPAAVTLAIVVVPLADASRL